MTTPTIGPAFTPDEQAALDHAWAWFSLHASQRMQVINFYLLTLSFLTAAYVKALDDKASQVATAVACAGLVVSAAFVFLDRRTRHLVKIAEAALAPLQERLAQASSSPVQLVAAAAAPLVTPQQRIHVTYTKILEGLGIVASIGFVVAAAYAIRR
jgi:alkylhydroperoxidase/carboxymuconolactone decarboxylase family protein YurZ